MATPSKTSRRKQAPRSFRTDLIRAVVTLGVAYAPYMGRILLGFAVVVAAITGNPLPGEGALNAIAGSVQESHSPRPQQRAQEPQGEGQSNGGDDPRVAIKPS
jgi:hypothetical protein